MLRSPLANVPPISHMLSLNAPLCTAFTLNPWVGVMWLICECVPMPVLSRQEGAARENAMHEQRLPSWVERWRGKRRGGGCEAAKLQRHSCADTHKYAHAVTARGHTGTRAHGGKVAVARTGHHRVVVATLRNRTRRAEHNQDFSRTSHRACREAHWISKTKNGQAGKSGEGSRISHSAGRIGGEIGVRHKDQQGGGWERGSSCSTRQGRTETRQVAAGLTSSSASFLRIVVFPALSRPSTTIRTSFFVCKCSE